MSSYPTEMLEKVYSIWKFSRRLYGGLKLTKMVKLRDPCIGIRRITEFYFLGLVWTSSSLILESVAKNLTVKYSCSLSRSAYTNRLNSSRLINLISIF